MFYAAQLLTQGPLKLIWIASHLSSRRLSKAEVVELNVVLSVDEIERLAAMPAPDALRTSSHLLFGVARIFSRQVEYLWQDASSAQARLISAGRSLAAHKGSGGKGQGDDRATVTVPLEAITLAEEPMGLLLGTEDLQDLSFTLTMPSAADDIALVPAGGFGDAGARHLRASFLAPSEELLEDELLEPLPYDLAELEGLEPETPQQRQQQQKQQEEQQQQMQQDQQEEQQEEEAGEPGAAKPAKRARRGAGAEAADVDMEEAGPAEEADEQLASPTRALWRSARGAAAAAAAAASDATGGATGEFVGSGDEAGTSAGAGGRPKLQEVARKLQLGQQEEQQEDHIMQEEEDHQGLVIAAEEQATPTAPAAVEAPQTPGSKRGRGETAPSPRAKRAHAAAALRDALPDGTPNTTLSTNAVRALLMDRSPLIKRKEAARAAASRHGGRRGGGSEAGVLLLGLPVSFAHTPHTSMQRGGLLAGELPLGAPELRGMFERAVGIAPAAAVAKEQQGGKKAPTLDRRAAAAAADAEMEDHQPLEMAVGGADPFGYGQLQQTLPPTQALEQEEQEGEQAAHGMNGTVSSGRAASAGAGVSISMASEDSLGAALLMEPGSQEAEETEAAAAGQLHAALSDAYSQLSPRAKQVLQAVAKRSAKAAASGDAHAAGSDSTQEQRATRAQREKRKAAAAADDGAAARQPAVSLQGLVAGKGRLAAARCFYELMVLQTRGCVALAQEQPYGDVAIALREGACSKPVESH